MTPINPESDYSSSNGICPVLIRMNHSIEGSSSSTQQNKTQIDHSHLRRMSDKINLHHSSPNSNNKMQSRTISSISPRMTSTVTRISLIFVLLCWTALSANAFNLENRLPLNKFGAQGSYFGYSVAEHVDTESGEDIKW